MKTSDILLNNLSLVQRILEKVSGGYSISNSEKILLIEVNKLLHEQLIELEETSTTNEVNFDNLSLTKEIKIANYFKYLGIPVHLLGYKYLFFVIMNKYQQDEDIIKIGEVYSCTAKKFDTTPNRVERAIRNAIEISSNNNSEKYKELFSYNVSKRTGRPTNIQFIQNIINDLKFNNVL